MPGNILQVSMTPRSELLITGLGPPDCATMTFFGIADSLENRARRRTNLPDLPAKAAGMPGQYHSSAPEFILPAQSSPGPRPVARPLHRIAVWGSV